MISPFRVNPATSGMCGIGRVSFGVTQLHTICDI